MLKSKRGLEGLKQRDGNRKRVYICDKMVYMWKSDEQVDLWGRE